MNRERLERLITVLEGVAAANKAFNLTRWVSTKQELGLSSATTSGSFEESCGTACCAMGYAALDPRFQAEGLKLSVWRGDIRHLRTSITSIAQFNAWVKASASEGCFWATPTFAGLEDFEAAGQFFGVTTKAAEYLFDPEAYEDWDERPILPAEVIERVHALIANNGKVPEQPQGD